MYDIQDGPLPAGTQTRSSYAFSDMRVGQWFFAPNVKPNTVRAAVYSYKHRHAPETKFSCRSALLDGTTGTVCKRLA